jgi:hypothetical protein
MSETYQLPADFKKITLQDIFNKAWEHFIIGDGKPSWSTEQNCCMYLDEYGNKCAVGLCIPDGCPAQKIFRNFSGLINIYPELFDDNSICDYTSEQINYFQKNLHDDLTDCSGKWIHNKKQMRQKYIELAEKYKLTIPAPSTCNS